MNIYCYVQKVELLGLFIIFHLQYSHGSKSKAPHQSDEHRLVHNLFKHYDKNIRPRYNSSDTVLVSVRFSLQQINDLDEKRQILKISGWLTAEWKDDFLIWNPEEYGGLHKLVISPQQMWVPKLAIGNSATKLFDSEHYRRFWITVKSDGQSRWQPGGVFAIACALDMNFYPFDDQVCTIEIETWVYTSDVVNLTNSLNYIGMDTYVPHGEWTVIKTNVTSTNVVYKYYLTESFPEVYCTIHIRRKYTFYFMYILMPCLMLSGVLLTIFLLPAQSGEKVSLGVSILVAISVFLLLVAGNVPDTSDAVPIIAIYLTYFMMVNTLAVAMAVIVIKLHYKSPSLKPPNWARYLVFNCLARMVCMNGNGKYDRILRSTNPYEIANQRSTRGTLESNLMTTDTYLDDIRASERKKSRNLSSPLTTPDGFEHYELLPQANHHAKYNGGNACTCRRGTRPMVNANHSMEDYEHNNHFSYASTNDKYDKHCERVIDEPINEWKCIAEVMDRVFLFVFLLITIIPTAFILGVVRLFKPDL